MHLPQLDELDQALRNFPALIDGIDGGGYESHEQIRRWLVSLEEIFDHNKMNDMAASIASLRALLQPAVHGVIIASFTISGNPSKRRIRNAAFADIAYRAERVVAAATASSRADLDEARRILSQIVALARNKRIPGSGPPGPADEGALRVLWSVIAADPDLENAATRVTGLVGETDTLVCFSKALAEA